MCILVLRTYRHILITLFVSQSFFSPAFSQQKPMLLWFDTPAYQPEQFSYKAKEFTNPFHFEEKGWFEAMPVGNGRLGAMVYGGVFGERIQLNEASLWDGYPRDAANPLSAKALPQVQQLMFDGKIDESEQLAEKTMLGIPLRINPYQSLGDLFIEHLHDKADTVYTQYRRWLSLDSAVAVTQFQMKGVNYRREVFASNTDSVIVIWFSCDKPNNLNLRIKLMREKDAVSSVSTSEPNTIAMQGRIHRLDDKTKKPVGMRFNAYIKAVSNTGKIAVAKNGVMTVKEASELVLYMTAATSYNKKDPSSSCLQIIRKAANQPVTTLFSAHLADYQSLYNRVKINLSAQADPFELPQDKRLARVIKNSFEDPYLSELLFQYGRYLLIASSRKGGLPANLQGIWNQSMNPPWSSDFHININLQMNYMAAEAVNLSECTLPLFSLIDSLAVHGKHTAKMMYNARGWVVHHLTDVFWRTAPADGVVGVWPMGGGWLAHHLFDHYLFSRDQTFLRDRAFPLMKGAAQFYLDFLVPIPEGMPMAGKLVTNPSHSPENAFEKADGSQFQFTYGATMDIQICRELFTSCLQAIDELSTPEKPFDQQFKAELKKALANLAPMQISPRTGILQEWIEDYKEPEIGHRHISHLYSLFPGNLINAQTLDFYAAARKSLERRLKGNPNFATEEAKNRYKSYGSYLDGKSFGGWQSVWIAMMWLRLGEAEEAYKHHQYQLKYGMKPNLFGAAYQLDGTFGSSNVVAEMLLQSNTGALNLLPALPKFWQAGFVSGLRARNGYEVDIRWEKNQLAEAKIISKNGGLCRLLVSKPVKVFLNGQEVATIKNNQNEITFSTQKGDVYTINAAQL
ncbi:glycoside hydrolase family 95 protein [Rhodocytophaga aerolata]|uniref:Glycoside hydrolase family 95 protein n=1 Tax=Rhodocytophaga aerolata TaxID=455078 RepID=A0ABT8RGZ8_9BACT|nr:glycoside hydrolase family 95 protein [Rhodocytophaga aerolata]MDO1451385.1 glycoside hydrolase family 95 protein [Rhodocytophaga aerolata]